MDSSEYEYVELLFSKLQYYEILQSLGKLLLAALNITHTDTFKIKWYVHLTVIIT